MTRVTREGKRAKHSFTITPSTSPEHSDPSVVITGHSDICHQIIGDCRPWHSPLLKALSYHLFPKGKWDWRMAADREEQIPKPPEGRGRKLMKVVTTHPDKDAALRTFAISSSTVNPQ